MIQAVINSQFLYWVKDKNIYPGCLETDTHLLLIIKEGNLIQAFSFSNDNEVNQLNLTKIHILDIEFLVKSSLSPYSIFSKECIVYIYSKNRISKEYYSYLLSNLDKKSKVSLLTLIKFYWKHLLNLW